MTEVKARKTGARWTGYFRFGTYWFPVKRRGQVATYASAETARSAALKAAPSTPAPI